MDMDGLLHEAILQTLAVKDNRAENFRASENICAIKDDNKYVTMCYVPMQQWEELYDEDMAYKCGTAFPSLNKPFAGGGK